MTTAPSTTAPVKYCFGAFLVPPYEVSLCINPTVLTIEEFRADLPKIVARLEGLIMEAQSNGKRNCMGLA